MTKAEYLHELKKHLSVLSIDEQNNALEYYTEYFEDAGSDSEAEIISRLGSPKNLADNIIRESAQPAVVEHSSDSYNSGEFSALDIRTICSSVFLIPSDRYGIELKEGSRTYFEHSIVNGVLTVKEQKTLGVFSLFSGFTGGFVKVYYPSNALFDSINISVTSGGIEMESLSSIMTELNVVSGNIRGSRLSLGRCKIIKTSGSLALSNCKAEKLEIRNISGSNTLEALSSNGLILKNTSGGINVSGRLLGENEITSTSGRVTLEIDGNLNDYRKNFHMTSGSLYINGNKIKGYSELSSNSFPNSISVSTVSGSIHIDFKE